MKKYLHKDLTQKKKKTKYENTCKPKFQGFILYWFPLPEKTLILNIQHKHGTSVFVEVFQEIDKDDRTSIYFVPHVDRIQ